MEDMCYGSPQVIIFPHTRLVLPVLHPNKFLNCTCTIKWLQNYYFVFDQYFDLNFIAPKPDME